jgi:hypothetical protein
VVVVLDRLAPAVGFGVADPPRRNGAQVLGDVEVVVVDDGPRQLVDEDRLAAGSQAGGPPHVPFEVHRAAEQARLNVAHARALDEHGRAVKSWESERASISGQERLNRRRAARHRMLLGGVCAPVGAFVGMAAVVPIT